MTNRDMYVLWAKTGVITRVTRKRRELVVSPTVVLILIVAWMIYLVVK